MRSFEVLVQIKLNTTTVEQFLAIACSLADDNPEIRDSGIYEAAKEVRAASLLIEHLRNLFCHEQFILDHHQQQSIINNYATESSTSQDHQKRGFFCNHQNQNQKHNQFDRSFNNAGSQEYNHRSSQFEEDKNSKLFTYSTQLTLLKASKSLIANVAKILYLTDSVVLQSSPSLSGFSSTSLSRQLTNNQTLFDSHRGVGIGERHQQQQQASCRDTISDRLDNVANYSQLLRSFGELSGELVDLAQCLMLWRSYQSSNYNNAPVKAACYSQQPPAQNFDVQTVTMSPDFASVAGSGHWSADGNRTPFAGRLQNWPATAAYEKQQRAPMTSGLRERLLDTYIRATSGREQTMIRQQQQQQPLALLLAGQSNNGSGQQRAPSYHVPAAAGVIMRPSASSHAMLDMSGQQQQQQQQQQEQLERLQHRLSLASHADVAASSRHLFNAEEASEYLFHQALVEEAEAQDPGNNSRQTQYQFASGPLQGATSRLLLGEPHRRWRTFNANQEDTAFNRNQSITNDLDKTQQFNKMFATDLELHIQDMQILFQVNRLIIDRFILLLLSASKCCLRQGEESLRGFEARQSIVVQIRASISIIMAMVKDAVFSLGYPTSNRCLSFEDEDEDEQEAASAQLIDGSGAYNKQTDVDHHSQLYWPAQAQAPPSGPSLASARYEGRAVNNNSLMTTTTNNINKLPANAVAYQQLDNQQNQQGYGLLQPSLETLYANKQPAGHNNNINSVAENALARLIRQPPSNPTQLSTSTGSFIKSQQQFNSSAEQTGIKAATTAANSTGATTNALGVRAPLCALQQLYQLEQQQRDNQFASEQRHHYYDHIAAQAYNIQRPTTSTTTATTNMQLNLSGGGGGLCGLAAAALAPSSNYQQQQQQQQQLISRSYGCRPTGQHHRRDQYQTNSTAAAQNQKPFQIMNYFLLTWNGTQSANEAINKLQTLVEPYTRVNNYKHLIQTLNNTLLAYQAGQQGACLNNELPRQGTATGASTDENSNSIAKPANRYPAVYPLHTFCEAQANDIRHQQAAWSNDGDYDDNKENQAQINSLILSGGSNCNAAAVNLSRRQQQQQQQQLCRLAARSNCANSVLLQADETYQQQMLQLPNGMSNGIHQTATTLGHLLLLNKRQLVNALNLIFLGEIKTNLIERVYEFTDCPYTKHEHRETILSLLQCARIQLNKLVKLLYKLRRRASSANELNLNQLRQLAEQVGDTCAELKFELQTVVIEQGDELDRFNIQMDLMKELKHYCLVGDVNRAEKSSSIFAEQSEQLVELCKKLNQISPTHKMKITTKSLAIWFESNVGQLLACANLLSRNSRSKVLKDCTWAYFQVWSSFYDDFCQIARQVAYLTHAHDYDADRSARVALIRDQVLMMRSSRNLLQAELGSTDDRRRQPLSSQNIADPAVLSGATSQVSNVANNINGNHFNSNNNNNNNNNSETNTQECDDELFELMRSSASDPIAGDSLDYHSFGGGNRRRFGAAGNAGLGQASSVQSLNIMQPPDTFSIDTDSPRSLDHYYGFGQNYRQRLLRRLLAHQEQQGQELLDEDIIEQEQLDTIQTPPPQQATYCQQGYVSWLPRDYQYKCHAHSGELNNRRSMDMGVPESIPDNQVVMRPQVIVPLLDDEDQCIRAPMPPPARKAPPEPMVHKVPPRYPDNGPTKSLTTTTTTTTTSSSGDDSAFQGDRSPVTSRVIQPGNSQQVARQGASGKSSSSGGGCERVGGARSGKKKSVSLVTAEEPTEDESAGAIDLVGQESEIVGGNPTSDSDKWDENSDDAADAILRGAKETAQMALSMYQFTKGEGELNTTQDLFTQAELFAEQANEIYKEVRCFSYKIPAGDLKKELLDHLSTIPALVQQLQFVVKNPTVGNPATFAKVDGVIRETRGLMDAVNRVVNATLACRQHYNMAIASMRKRTRTLSPTYRNDKFGLEFNNSGARQSMGNFGGAGGRQGPGGGGGMGSEPDI